jgi:quercetin dioxygenase-like cupin family protein
VFDSSRNSPRRPHPSDPEGRLLTGVAAAILWATAIGCRSDPPRPAVGEEKDRTVISHALPRMDGAHLVVEVTYGPGGSSPPHSHPCPVVGYVIEGAYRTQVRGEPEAIYRAGESFYEAPSGIHLISANASDKEPVRFLATFTCDQEAPLSTDVPEARTAPGGQP